MIDKNAFDGLGMLMGVGGVFLATAAAGDWSYLTRAPSCWAIKS